MSIETLIVLMAIGLVTGALVGTVGIGGVLLVPALVLVGGLAVQEATPIATLSFLFTGIAGSLAYSRQRRIDWSIAKWLLVGSVPGAVAGAATNVALSATAITIAIDATLSTAAVQSFRDPTARSFVRRRSLGVKAWIVTGVVVGFGSTLSGTGGPVLLIPVMLLAGSTVGLAVSASQPIQIPIAIFGAISFLAYGALDWELALAFGVTQGTRSPRRRQGPSRLRVEILRRLVAWALVVSAAIFTLKAAIVALHIDDVPNACLKSGECVRFEPGVLGNPVAVPG